jgi:hypothetical protein
MSVFTDLDRQYTAYKHPTGVHLRTCIQSTCPWRQAVGLVANSDAGQWTIVETVNWNHTKLRWKLIQNTIINLCFFKTVWPCIVIDSLWIKPTDALISNFVGITTLHVSGSVSAHHQEFLAVHRHWYNLRSLVTECYQALPAPGSIRSPNCINCTNAGVWLRTPDDGQKGCPKHVES